MKTSTVVIVGLGGAAALFLVMRTRSAVKPPTSAAGRAAAAPDTLQRAAISLGTSLGAKLIDAWGGRSSGTSDDAPRDAISSYTGGDSVFSLGDFQLSL